MGKVWVELAISDATARLSNAYATRLARAVDIQIFILIKIMINIIFFVMH